MERQDKKMKYVIRLAPCSCFDVERMASWLHDMAQSGYILYKMIFNIGLFKREEARNIKYRLTELPFDSLYNDRSPSGEEEMIAICEAGGWRYITKRGFFGIFATENEAIPELQTETKISYLWLLLYIFFTAFVLQVLPIDLEHLKWNILIAILLTIPFLRYGKKAPQYLGYISWLVIMWPCFINWRLLVMYGFLITWINEGSDVFLPTVLSSIFFLFLIVYALIAPIKYFFKMWRNTPLDYTKNWRRKAPFYRITYISIVIILFYSFTNLLNGCTVTERPGDHLQPLTAYEGTFPFATMEDLTAQYPIIITEWQDESKVVFDAQKMRASDVPNILYNWDEPGSHLEIKSEWIAPEVLYFQQEACITLSDGQQLRGSLSVTYYDTKSPWLAWELMREYKKIAHEKLADNYQELELPDLIVEDALAYTDGGSSVFYPRLLLRSGSQMVKVYFYQEPTGYQIPIEQWSKAFAESIQEYDVRMKFQQIK